MTSIQQNFFAGTWWLGRFGENSRCYFSEGIGDHSTSKFAPIRREFTRAPHQQLDLFEMNGRSHEFGNQEGLRR